MIMGIVGLIFMLSMFFALHMVFFDPDKVGTAIFTLVLIVIWFLITLKVKELQEPWMTLDEFLKSGFEGLCWIALTNKFVFECRYQEWDFIVKNGCVNYESITHVMPIHKPEPPR